MEEIKEVEKKEENDFEKELNMKLSPATKRCLLRDQRRAEEAALLETMGKKEKLVYRMKKVGKPIGIALGTAGAIAVGAILSGGHHKEDGAPEMEPIDETLYLDSDENKSDVDEPAEVISEE